jgi:hypothetical protein
MGIDAAFIERVVERWRGATMGSKRKVAESLIGDVDKLNVSPLESDRAALREAALALRREHADAPQKGPAATSPPLRRQGGDRV